MSSKYGVTPTGVLIKRLDEVMEELHTDLSAGFETNTRLNPKSYLNVMLTDFADKIAELWEVAEKIYHAQYPYSAEDASLDNAVQFGGITRELARPTYYPIHAECVDGTTLPQGSMIKSNTNPAIQFYAIQNTTVTRSAFNVAKVRVAVVQPESLYTVVLNATQYNYHSNAAPTEIEILEGLRDAIDDPDFTVSLEGNAVIIAAVNVQTSNQLILSGNLTTASVTAIVTYASETNGEVALPNGTITEIVTGVTGLISVVNRIPYIAGRLLQTDVELRKSYAEKIYARSNRMIESIKSAILLNCQGAVGVAGYQNDTNVEDADGRWPHCVEMVVDGGSDMDIALQIWDKKTDGIQSFGDTEVIIPGDEGEPVTIRFNRPEHVYVWFSLSLMLNPIEILPPNYIEAIQGIVVDAMAKVEPGVSIIPQRLVNDRIYSTVPGIAFIETSTYPTTDANEPPGTYELGMIVITPRQRAVTDEARIEVVISA